jgi:hypothetical protein
MKSWTLKLLEDVPNTPWKKGYVLAVWAPETPTHGFARLSDWAEEKELVEEIREFLKKHFEIKAKVVKVGDR